MSCVPSNVLNATEKICDLHQRLKEYRRLSAVYPNDTKIWFNLSVDAHRAAEQLLGETCRSAQRAVDLSPTIRTALPAGIKRLLSAQSSDRVENRLSGGHSDRSPSSPPTAVPANRKSIRPYQLANVPASAPPSIASPAVSSSPLAKTVFAGPPAAEHARLPKVGDYRIVSVVSQSPCQMLYDAVGADGRSLVTLRCLPDLPSHVARLQFEQEMRSVAAHCGFARPLGVVFDDGGTPVQVLERLCGSTLTSRCAEGRRELGAVLPMIYECALALDRLERRGAHHGDLRPDHVVCAELPGNLKVTLLGGGAALPATARGTMVLSEGRLEWLAPELQQGARPGASTDVFGLGALLYFAATGRPPPRRRNLPMATIPVVSALLTGAALGPSRDPRLLRQLDLIIERSLTVSPQQRFSSASEFALALSAVGELTRR